MVTSVQVILYSQPTEVGKLVLIPLRPLFGAPDYIKKTRRGHYLRTIEAILNWDQEKKMKLLNMLTDVVSVTYFSIEDYIQWYNRVEEVLNELKEFEELNKLKSYLDSFDYNQKREIIEESVEQLKKGIRIIEEKLYQLAKEVKDDNKRIEEILVVVGYLERVYDLLEESWNENKRMIAALLALRFVAYLQGKISLDNLVADLVLNPDDRLTKTLENGIKKYRLYEELLNAP